MLFNSLEYLVLLPTVFILYWTVFQRSLKAQNFLLVVVSYVFYGWWDWRFLSLIFLSSLIDFTVGRSLGQTDDARKRKYLLSISLIANLGMLGVFKYYNFFVESFVGMFQTMGVSLAPATLQFILPVGISFYTFQTLSYTIDVYRKDIEPSRDIVAFLAYVSFFPQLVAGPIERATNLLPQFYKKRTFTYEQGLQGVNQILWGLFKKMVIADNCAMMVDQIFADPTTQNSGQLILGAIYFAFQIYGDFSGYSDIAIGTSRLFGFDLMANFRYPYFSRDIAEFWRRWHISLSTWFRDYLYIPLGGSRGGLNVKLRNTFIIFIVSGFWHGANWTFIIWGFLNAVYYLPVMLSGKNRRFLGGVAEGRWLPTPREGLQIFITFVLTCIAWVFFRAESVGHAWTYLVEMFTSGFGPVGTDAKFIPYIAVLLLIEWIQRDKEYPLQLTDRPLSLRWGLAIPIVLGIVLFANVAEDMSFIYFQF
ncbi:MBOAT family O-acyltransferase [Pontibacter sp. G13]|uniref:MBOAT family O-acyltransferase n=1 Tax=Pontibacter sp. G13 TaxID=3074898 RepID=UPI00288910E7|nr:MBOAT family O-acyltransferase [Pontibacter sp. G13]WNJ19763.1 MBOAT family O-acyltransferase [Pontibacter sp. G13]